MTNDFEDGMWTVRWLGETHRMNDEQVDAIFQAVLDRRREP